MVPTRVLLADDHAVVRAGLRNALLALPGLEVVGEVEDGPQLSEALARLRPDLLVVDVSMPEFDPVPAIRQVKSDYPALRILVVSAYDDEAYVVGMLEEGVDGYHLKDQPLASLQMAVQSVLNGERWISGPLVDRLLHHGPAPAHDLTTLTQRQRELLRWLVQGNDNRRIALATGLSVKTVENHLTRLYRALRVDSRLEAVNFAMRHPEVLASSGLASAGQTTGGQPAGEERPPAPGGEHTVLLVDDNARYRQQLGRLIGKSFPGALLYEAGDISEALRLGKLVRPQLALIDVVLTDEDGIQCARRLKAISPATRVVLTSAYPDREFRRLGLGAGAVAFLDKKDLDAATVRQIVEDSFATNA